MPTRSIYVTDENGKLTGLLLEELAITSVVKHAPVTRDMLSEVVETTFPSGRNILQKDSRQSQSQAMLHHNP